MRKSQYNCLNLVITSTFRKVFDTWSQDVVDICLEMFNRVSAEHTVAIRKTKFLTIVSNISGNIVCAEATKELTTFITVLLH